VKTVKNFDTVLREKSAIRVMLLQRAVCPVFKRMKRCIVREKFVTVFLASICTCTVSHATAIGLRILPLFLSFVSPSYRRMRI